jgi:hypothetical protein
MKRVSYIIAQMFWYVKRQRVGRGSYSIPAKAGIQLAHTVGWLMVKVATWKYLDLVSKNWMVSIED